MLFVFWLCFGILMLVFINIGINILTFPRILPKRLPEIQGVVWPRISILVPARNGP